MRSRSLSAVLAVTGAVLAGAPGAVAQSPAGDAVTGTVSGGTGRLPITLAIDAHSGPSGESPSGTVTFSISGSFLATERVSCLAVSGTRATIVAPFAEVAPGSGPPEAAVISVSDNGGPLQDGVILTFSPTVPPTCSPPPAPIEANLWSGDLTVVDAPPVPTAKAQCEDGGWATFAFRNQGQCVAFTQRGPKP